MEENTNKSTPEEPTPAMLAAGARVLYWGTILHKDPKLGAAPAEYEALAGRIWREVEAAPPKFPESIAGQIWSAMNAARGWVPAEGHFYAHREPPRPAHVPADWVFEPYSNATGGAGWRAARPEAPAPEGEGGE